MFIALILKHNLQLPSLKLYCKNNLYFFGLEYYRLT